MPSQKFVFIGNSGEFGFGVAKRFNVQLATANFDLTKMALNALQVRVTIHHDKIDMVLSELSAYRVIRSN